MKHCMLLSVGMLLAICMLTACGASPSMPAAQSQLAEASEAATPTTANDNSSSSDVDVDLTKLSSIMVYAEVYNMMTSPDEYLGKTVKMQGPYYASYFEDTKKYYHYVIIEDATACCQQGLEFIWDGEHKYPNDYPIDGTNIEVTGVFGSYEELGLTYYYLTVEDVVIQ